MKKGPVYSKGPGRRPRRLSRMPRSSFTADIHELVFLRAYSDRYTTVSAGIQQAIRRLVESDKAAAGYMSMAQSIISLAERELELDEVPPTQVNLWSYISEHYDRLSDEVTKGKGVPAVPA